MRQPRIRTVAPAEAARAILTAMFGHEVDGPPSTPMGKAEADWLAARQA